DSRFCLPHETARCVWRCAKATALSVGEGVAWVASNAILLRVICSSTPAGGHGLAWRPYPCCVRLSARSPLLRRTHDEAQSHTPRGRCVRLHLPDDLNVEFLFDDPLIVVAAPNSGLARRRKIDFADLADTPVAIAGRYVDLCAVSRSLSGAKARSTQG